MNMDRETLPVLSMLIKAVAYRHQIEAFNFVCGMFGLVPEDGAGNFLPGALAMRFLWRWGQGKRLLPLPLPARFCGLARFAGC